MEKILEHLNLSISTVEHWWPLIPWAALLTLVLYTSYKLADVILVVATAMAKPLVFLSSLVWITLQISGLRVKIVSYVVLAKIAGQKKKKVVEGRDPAGSVIKL